MKTAGLTWAIDEGRQRLTEATGKTHLRVFSVQNPITVFIRATRCQVAIQYHQLEQVEIHAKLYNAFGLKFVTEQDEAGVYIIVKRRRLLGLVSQTEFLLKVPSYANLAFNLQKGALKVERINGIIELPPLRQHLPMSIPQLPAQKYNSLSARTHQEH